MRVHVLSAVLLALGVGAEGFMRSPVGLRSHGLETLQAGKQLKSETALHVPRFRSCPGSLRMQGGGDYLSSLTGEGPSTTVTVPLGNPNSKTSNPSWALLFDCDGVIVLTEELHRLAYNGAFQDFGLQINGQPVDWSVEYYDVLQNTVGGGKPKMKWHFAQNGWPSSKLGPVPATEEELSDLVDKLQDKKTEIYKRIVTEVAEARPGVLEMMDEVLERPDIAAGICSAATRGGFDQVVNSVVKKDRLDRFDCIIAGDDVPRKKPDPIIYKLAAERIGVPPERCIVVEDSLVGLRAAKGAGCKCIITYTSSTADQDFYAEGADAVVPDFTNVKLNDIFAPVLNGATTILDGIRLPPR